MLNSIKGELRIDKSTVRSGVAGMQSELQLDGCWELGGRQERAALGGERARLRARRPNIDLQFCCIRPSACELLQADSRLWLALALTKLQG